MAEGIALAFPEKMMVADKGKGSALGIATAEEPRQVIHCGAQRGEGGAAEELRVLRMGSAMASALRGHGDWGYLVLVLVIGGWG